MDRQVINNILSMIEILSEQGYLNPCIGDYDESSCNECNYCSHCRKKEKVNDLLVSTRELIGNI